jgi:hypothetical protein
MTTVRVEAQVSPKELLKAVGQLDIHDLDRFVAEVITLQAQRKARSLPEEEATLLVKINQGIAPEIQSRYALLIEKRRTERLTPEELDELRCLGEQVERLESERIGYLAELARLRGMTLDALIDELGIQAPDHA